MILLKHLKKQFNQLVMPEIEALPPSALDLYSQNTQRNELAFQEEVEPLKKQSVKDVGAKDAIPTFQETFQGAYSHGLEQIYALQDVDVSKIKTINFQNEPEEQETRQFDGRYSLPQPSQIEFNLEGEFVTTLDSFVLYEPASVLNLSAHADKYLKQCGKAILKDLVEEDWSAFSINKGTGQGHIDEIRAKLKEYIAGKQLKCCYTVDFEAFVRCLIPEGSRTVLYVLLERYHLAHLITLSPSESVEVRRFSADQRESCIQNSLKILRSENSKAFCHTSLRKITDVFVKPWLRGRLGFCRRFELLDRFEQISENPSAMHQVIRFLGDIYFDGSFPLNTFLAVIDEQIYCADETLKNEILKIENAAMSYFYRTDVSYTVAELVSWLAREHATSWKGYSEGYLEKILRTSPRFVVVKKQKGQLIVRLF